VSLGPAGTGTFTATVVGASNSAVICSISPAVGTITPSGLYSAPANQATAQTVILTAQSLANPSISASATISLDALTGSFTYYVDSAGGSDTNPGTLAAPWKTIAKVNKTPMAAGQSVGFKRGGTWLEQLTIPSGGDAGLPITFGAYGTGPNPTISGADVVSSWNSTTVASDN